MARKDVERKFSITAFYSAHDFSWDSSYEFSGESHEMWEMVFVMGGVVKVTEDEKVYRLEKNNMIIHAPFEFHRIRSAEGTSPRLCVMSFYADGVLPQTLSEGVFALSSEQCFRYREAFERIHSFMRSDSDSPYSGQDAADRLASFLTQLGGENVSSYFDTSPAATEYRKLVLAMSGSVCENKTLEDIARQCGDSVSYIKKLFRKYAGISPKAYYNNLRVAHALKLLREGHAVSEIAERMNFSSSSYFSAFFKKHTGSSPIEHKPN